MNYLIKSFKRLLTRLHSQYPYQTPIVGKGTEGWQNTSGTYRKIKKSKWWRWYCE